MLEVLNFRHVGPAPELGIEFRSRLNFLTGDSGLGKTFLLDAAWWALTRTWAHTMLAPHRAPSRPAIHYRYRTKAGKPHQYKSRFDRGKERWSLPQIRPPMPGLVLYAQADAGFSVWDPARNYRKEPDPARPSAYRFSSTEVWDGLARGKSAWLCNGLIADWANWQLENGEAMEQLRAVLAALSPSAAEPLEPGALVKVSLEDARKHPTIKAPYGLEVPLVHASAGIRRIAALAYLLVWSWQEHLASANLRGDPPAQQIVFLIDELEAHLHPKWQRRIVPALLRVMEALAGKEWVSVQFIASTHSPLVLASAEPEFRDDQDALWEMRLEEGTVSLVEFPWSRQGDANAWLTSSIFDLAEPGSLEAEKAITAALELFRRETRPGEDELRQVDGALRGALGELDPFWIRWTGYRRRVEGAR